MPRDSDTPHLLPPPDPAGAVIRAKRLNTRVTKPGRRTGPMTMRELERRVTELETKDPTRYRAYSRSVQAHIEFHGAQYLKNDITDIRMINALVQVLWDGDTDAFENETGVRIYTRSIEA